MKISNDFFEAWDQVKLESPEIADAFNEAEDVSNIINALIDARKQKRISQRELAKICGMKQSAIARIESGSTNPRINTLVRIMRKLGQRISIANIPQVKREDSKIVYSTHFQTGNEPVNTIKKTSGNATSHAAC